MTTGRIFNIQHFSSEDGPGIRTTVFLQGCNLRCPWCHNPESQKMQTQIMHFVQKCIGCKRCVENCPEKELFSESCRHCGKCAENCPTGALVAYGKTAETAEILAECIQDRDLYDMSDGGVTVSGGEPLLQTGFLKELLEGLKAEGIHTALETAGCYEFERLEQVLPFTDLVFMDLKCMDEQKHKEVIGASNAVILENIRKVAAQNVDFVIRIPVICGFNDDELPAMAAFIETLPEHVKVELLAYHEICSGKYTALRREFRVKAFRVPGQKEMDTFRSLFGKRCIQ